MVVDYEQVNKPFSCSFCGRSFRTQQQLYMHQKIHQGGQQESTPPGTPPKEAPVTFKKEEFQEALERKKLELEELRIDNEIKRLKAPDIPQSNFFKEALEQQQQHFNQIIEMNKQTNDLRLEIEKLKIQSELTPVTDDNSYLMELMKYLPQIMAAKKKEGDKVTETSVRVKEEQPRIRKTAKQVEQYQADIQAGKITEEQAYKDFCKEMPEIAKIATKEQFLAKFNEIKAGKKINIPEQP